MRLGGNWLRRSATESAATIAATPTTDNAKARVADSNSQAPTPAETVTANGSKALENSAAIAASVPPISRYRFFLHPCHMLRNERYILTRTTPLPLPNQTR